MELSLERVDLHQVQTTCRKTTRLLPQSKMRQQKVVIGDETGSLLCFGMKKGEIETVFKTPPLGKECSRLELGGVGEERDKIFMASSGTVRAFSKKGKEFLRFNTNLTEPIRSMWVGEADIHTGGEYMYNQFIDCKDTYFFMSNDRINDLVCERIVGGAQIECAMACQDRMVRVVAGNELLYEAAMGGPVLTIDRYSNAAAGSSADAAAGSGFGRLPGDATPAGLASNESGKYKELVYGTANGMVGQLLLDANEMRPGWTIDPVLEGRRGKAGGVQSIASHDITRDGIKDLMIGRDDGGIEVWSFDTGPQPKLVFDKSLQESITALECGLVTNVHFDELVCTTYSGKPRLLRLQAVRPHPLPSPAPAYPQPSSQPTLQPVHQASSFRSLPSHLPPTAWPMAPRQAAAAQRAARRGRSVASARYATYAMSWRSCARRWSASERRPQRRAATLQWQSRVQRRNSR